MVLGQGDPFGSRGSQLEAKGLGAGSHRPTAKSDDFVSVHSILKFYCQFIMTYAYTANFP